MTPHIESKKEKIAKIVLMPGDPLRDKYIAETYLDDYKLVNKVRNMFAYTGYYKGEKTTVFASGMGTPSMGIYSYELFKFYDVDTIIRIGSCGSYQKDIDIYDLILVDQAYSETNYANNLSLNKSKLIESSQNINDKVIKTAHDLGIDLKIGNIHTSDTFYNPNLDYKQLVKDYDVLGVEMEAFALFNNAKLLNKQAGCILTVSDSLVTNEELDSKKRETGFNKMMELVLEASLKIRGENEI